MRWRVGLRPTDQLMAADLRIRRAQYLWDSLWTSAAHIYGLFSNLYGKYDGMKTPAAKRKVLVFLAGLLWSLVGIGLIAASIYWLRASTAIMILVVILGIFGGGLIYYFGFSSLARKNLSRIFEQSPGKDKVCLFAFQNKRSYLIVLVMISMGYALRHSPIPKIYLSPLYMAIGLGRILSSLIYYKNLIT